MRRSADRHFVLDQPLAPPFPAGTSRVLFGMGCFWGAEKRFWSLPGIVVTAVGYAGGTTKDATYEQVCTGSTGHAEVVLVVYEALALPFARLLQVFWESHDPTQGMRQGADVGTQYRSVIFTYDDVQLEAANRSRDLYQSNLTSSSFGRITTEIAPARNFHYAEDYHQQYLAKNPHGYCGLGGTGVCFETPVGAAVGATLVATPKNRG
jgi:peptide-methionine (S)-S-oxide reductase